jgi:hypothetical protein
MEPLFIKEAEDTPKIILNKRENNFEISGKSLPVEVIGFYSPVLNWLDRYVIEPNEKTVFKIRLEYVNSSSQMTIHEILSVLEKIKKQGKEIEIEWYFMEDDDEMRESGEEYSEIINIPFKFISYIPE